MAFYDTTGALQQGSHDDYLAGLRSRWQADVKKKQAAAHRGKVFKTAAAGAALFGGAIAAPLLGGGTAAASLPAAATQGIAPMSTAGGGMGLSLGKLLGSRGFEAALNVGTSLYGQRAQNKANKYATDANARLMADQIRMEQARIARQEEADALDRADAMRRFDAEEAWRAKQHAASEEERAYTRRLSDEREGRRAVYRPYQERAMRSLGSILGIG